MYWLFYSGVQNNKVQWYSGPFSKLPHFGGEGWDVHHFWVGCTHANQLVEWWMSGGQAGRENIFLIFFTANINHSQATSVWGPISWDAISGLLHFYFLFTATWPFLSLTIFFKVHVQNIEFVVKMINFIEKVKKKTNQIDLISVILKIPYPTIWK